MAQAPADDTTGNVADTNTSTDSAQVSQPGRVDPDLNMAASDDTSNNNSGDSNTNNDNNGNSNNNDNNDNKNKNNNAANDNDEKSNDLPPKTDVTLTLKGTPEYNSFPFTKESEKFYFMASVKASYFKEKDRAPIDLCCIIDESSSMSGDRIRLVKETVLFVLRNLTNEDRFGIVGYGSSATVRLALTKMDENGKKNAENVVNNIRASGMTALCEGLEYGIKMMRERNKDDSNQIASVMLFTDGQANVGVTSAQGIQKHIEEGGSGGGPTPNRMNRKLRRQRMPPQLQQQQLPQQQQQQQQQQTLTGKLLSMVMPSKAATDNNNNNNTNNNNNNNTNNTDKNDETDKGDNDEKNKDETDEGSIDKTLPCTINTFGFGANHNETLLEALAEWGRGMYTFIENTDTIAETFAECLGGLVSIVGRDLKVRVAALNGVEMVRCVSQGGYKVVESRAKQEYTITIPDIQSEENRDLVFEVKLPKLDEKRDAWPMAQISCTYQNVPKKRQDILSVIAPINRCNDDDEIGERNDELDAQCNRLLASEAMDIADKMAEKGDLTNARKVLSEAKQKIESSNTFMQQKKGFFKYAQNLTADIDDVTKDLSNRQSYKSMGGKKLKMSKKAHAMQRSVHSSNYASQRAYTNSSKHAMMSKFSKK